jgi:dTDP-4-amino-4,6-dideoxygalactose transaminase
MASVTGMFVPTYQGLSPADVLRPWLAEAMAATRPRSAAAPVETPARRRPSRSEAGPRPACFPFDVPDRLSFYRARNAIYHLFRALVASNPRLTVLAPDYYSGNEIMAIRAAGATIHYCPVDRNMQLDPDTVERLCTLHNPDLLYVIHYVGWPQPMPALVDLCRRRGMLLVEDCALSLLSEMDGRPLGTFGHWSVFCLYKTLALPNGALLVQNAARIESLERLTLRPAGSASVLGRTAELLVQRIRGRANGVGAALQMVKRGMGRAAGALDVERANVGDIGFNLEEVDLAMSPLSERLIERLDLADIRRRRVEHYRMLAQQLDDTVVPVFPRIDDGVCPLFFPILVRDKHEAAVALQQRGVDALEFWNDSVEPGGRDMSADARFLRQHVLELPIHQDLTPEHVAYVARQVSSLNLGTRGPGLVVRGSTTESRSASPVSQSVA